MSMFSRPVSGSRSTHRTCAVVAAQFIPGIVPLHSAGAKYDESSCMSIRVTNGSPCDSIVSSRVWSGGLPK